MRLSLATRSTLKQTQSLCPVCLALLPAEVFEHKGQVFLEKRCPEHGRFEVKISSDRRFYYDSVGAGQGGACCGGGACGPTGEGVSEGDGEALPLIERSATCIGLIEVVESCNLACPTCYADSPYHDPSEVRALSIEEIMKRIDAVIERKGPLDVLQLSGGEPTIHPRFLELMETLLKNSNIRYILLNTNGVRLAAEPAVTEALGALRKRYGRLELYLQFDGVQPRGNATCAGAISEPIRERAIDRSAEAGIPTTLAMTVTPDNYTHLGDAFRFGVSRRAIRGITLQPVFGSGRAPDETRGLVSLKTRANAPPHRYNVADLLRGLIDQSSGLLSDADFTPLPCGDPNCHTIGYVLRRGDDVIPASKLVDFKDLQGFLKDRVRFTMTDLDLCGCESEPLGQTLRDFELGPDSVFRLFLKPFMDAWTYDQDRIDRCCVHVVGEGGRLDSFCRHYAMRG